jgi:hypothetical protein
MFQGLIVTKPESAGMNFKGSYTVVWGWIVQGRIIPVPLNGLSHSIDSSAAEGM